MIHTGSETSAEEVKPQDTGPARLRTCNFGPEE